MLTATDLFAGAGGSSEGLAQAGYRVVIAANHWARAVETHTLNHPDTEHRTADLSETDWTTFPTTDVLWASPSCVWHARSGGRKAVPESIELARDTAGAIDRATAFAVVEAAEVHRYRAVIVENVVEFRNWVLYRPWLDMMGALGYRWQEMALDAADLGAAQRRRRLFIVFTRAGSALMPPVVPPSPASSILDDLPMRRLDRPMYISGQVEKITTGGPHVVMMRRNARPLDAAVHPVPTVTAGGVHHYLAERTSGGDWYRRFTPRELARAQGFPDHYMLTGTAAEQVRQIGNAVPVQVARWLGEGVAALVGEAVPA